MGESVREGGDCGPPGPASPGPLLVPTARVLSALHAGSLSGKLPSRREQAATRPPTTRADFGQGLLLRERHGESPPFPVTQLSAAALHCMGRGYRTTASDSLSCRTGGGGRNPAWVGRENAKIYVSTGFTRGKSRSNLGPAKWPLSLSVNLSLAQSPTPVSATGYVHSQLFSSSSQRPQGWHPTLPGRHGLLTWETGLLLSDFPWPSPCGLSLTSQWDFQLLGQT